MLKLIVLIVLLQTWALAVAVFAEAPRLAGPIGLEASVAFGLANNPRLSQAQGELRAAQARVDEAAGAYLPKLTAGLYANVGNVPMIVPGLAEPIFYSTLPNNGVSLNLNLMFPLYTGGRLQARMAEAEAEQRAELARTALAVREVTREVRSAYYESLQATSLVDTAQWKVEQQLELLLVTQQKIAAGSLAPYVERRVVAEVAAARQELNRALAEDQVARINLNVALGSAYDSVLELEPPASVDLPARTLAEDVQLSLRERPDLVVARAVLEVSNASLTQTLAAYSPQLALYTMAEAVRPRPAESGYQVGLVLSWPLFDGERGPRREAAQAIVETKESELVKLEQVVAGEVARSRARLEAAVLNRDLASAEVLAAAEELRITSLRFQLGRGIYLEVIDALAAEARARQSVVAAVRDSGVAQAEFYYAIGVLK